MKPGVDTVQVSPVEVFVAKFTGPVWELVKPKVRVVALESVQTVLPWGAVTVMLGVGLTVTVAWAWAVVVPQPVGPAVFACRLTVKGLLGQVGLPGLRVHVTVTIVPVARVQQQECREAEHRGRP
jgi:hypothetical protein